MPPQKASRSAPAPAVFLGVRVPAELLSRIDALVAQWSRPGFACTRSDVVRVLLTHALPAVAPVPKATP